jgi:8-oxo-dGTP pyrophosphatase MutT (NUDIX family)
MTISLSTVGLLVIRDRKLLLAFSKNKQCFYLPGGKMDGDESPEEALCREIAEELNVTLVSGDLEYYTHISAPAFGELNGVIMEQECFFVQRDIDPRPTSEIGEIKFFTLSEYLNEEYRAPGAEMILKKLKLDNYID